MLTPLLSGPNGYWETLDWQKALKHGGDALGLPFSGEFDFVKTTYVFPTTHMVAPKENVVACGECRRHGQRKPDDHAGRFLHAKRDGAGIVDAAGWILVLGTLLSVSLHGLVRMFSNGKGTNRE